MESRTLAQGDCIRRRRECLACGYRFTSYEHIEEKPFMVIKKDGRREPFDRKKLEKGIERALEKRPVSLNSIENIVTEIEDQAILSSGLNKEIETTALGEMVLSHLYSIDKVAYIRFASVYKQFSNLDEFVNEVKKVRK
jgi:transcriptional regulator nrdR